MSLANDDAHGSTIENYGTVLYFVSCVFAPLFVLMDGPDQWLETVRQCKYLPENDIKRLCEKV